MLKKIVAYLPAILTIILATLFICCSSTATICGVRGYVYNKFTSNPVQGVYVILYDGSMSNSCTTASNGYYLINFQYTTTEGCNSSNYTFPLGDQAADFYLIITDANGTNQTFVSNIGPVFNKNLSINVYLGTNTN
jgi:hypothetical protein